MANFLTKLMGSFFPIKKAPKKPKRTAAENRKYVFTQMPVWKSVLKMAIPGMIQMLVMGGYMFADSVIAVHQAADSYTNITDPSLVGYAPHDLVRMFMAGAAPITALMGAFTMLFSIGVATRVSINLGRGDVDRAKRTLRTGLSVSMIVSFSLIPILYFSAIPWMESQYPAAQAHVMAKHAFEFAWIMIIALPIQSFGQTVSGLFRIEGRNKEMLVVSLVPTAVNLILDYVFMGPAGLGIEGAAWATMIASGTASILAAVFVITMKSDIITFRNMYGKFKLLPIIGIVLVGVAPFFRQFAQSTTQTAEAAIIANVSEHIYHQFGTHGALMMTSIFAGAGPIFMLVFPVSFAFSQAARPIASFNYGAGNMKRVRQTIMFTMLYASFAGILLYFLTSFALEGPLLSALGSSNYDSAGVWTGIKDKSETVIKILLATLPLFSIAITGMTLFGSTDRILFSLIASTLRGFILIFPVLYIFKAIALAHPEQEFLFWWFYPVLGALTSIIAGIMIVITLKRLEMNHITLDKRIEDINAWVNFKRNLAKSIHDVKSRSKTKIRRAASESERTEIHALYQKEILVFKLAEEERIAAKKLANRQFKEAARIDFINFKKNKAQAKLSK